MSFSGRLLGGWGYAWCRARKLLLTLRKKKEEYENTMEKLQREVCLTGLAHLLGEYIEGVVIGVIEVC